MLAQYDSITRLNIAVEMEYDEKSSKGLMTHFIKKDKIKPLAMLIERAKGNLRIYLKAKNAMNKGIMTSSITKKLHITCLLAVIFFGRILN